jgi:hypothetical protein
MAVDSFLPIPAGTTAKTIQIMTMNTYHKLINGTFHITCQPISHLAKPDQHYATNRSDNWYHGRHRLHTDLVTGFPIQSSYI